ncbi:Uncharacterised protein [Mycobacteroides abscessus]|nr:Uncharacterised protein [Mycobacteroides abscessus]
MNYLDQALTSTYSASGVLLPGTGGVPIAPELHANPVVAWVSIVLAYAGAAAALAWALWKLVKHQQMLPLVLFAAGLVAANTSRWATWWAQSSTPTTLLGSATP